MVEYEGTHTVDEVWNLWIDGELRSEYVEKVRVKKETWGEDYQVKHILDSGGVNPVTHSITVTEEDLEEVLKDIVVDNNIQEQLR